MKNKKIIAFLCALSMIVSMFSMMTAFADATVGYALAGELSADGKTVTVNVTLDGVSDNTVTGGQINLNVPDGVTALSQISAECPGNSTLVYAPNLSKGIVYMNFASGSGYEIADGAIAKVTFTLSDALATDYTAALQAESNLITKSNGAGDIDAGTLKTTTDTVSKWKDPNAKSDAEERPSKQEEQDTPKDITTDKVGLNLTGEVSKDNKTVTVNVTLSGVTDNTVTGGQINLNVPDGVTALSQISAECPGNSTLVYAPNLSKGIVYMNFASGSGYEIADGALAKITFDLSNSPLADTYVAKLQAESNLITKSNGAGDLDGGTMDATQAVVKPAEADKGKATTVKLSDYMGEDKTTGKSAAEVAEAYEADDTKTEPLYITVDVTKDKVDEDGNVVKDEAGNVVREPAVYGTDYEAVYDLDGDGTPEVLTEAQFNNLIHGYEDADISDVIKNLKFNVYNTAKNAKIKTTLQANGDDTQLVNDQTKEDVKAGGTTETDKSKAPAFTAPTKETTTKSINTSTTKQSLDFTLSTGTDKDGNALDFGKLTIELTNVSGLTLDGVTVEYTAPAVADAEASPVTITDKTVHELGQAADGKYKVSFTPSAVGTVSYTLKYYKNADDETEAAKRVATYTITAATTTTTTDGGSSSSSGGGTAIAQGYQGSTTAGLPGSASFTDLGDADWATEAITMLAYQNVVSGYEDNTFRPNGNITRAEFAQILINAIGHQGDSADTYFDDVPTDAWFYHNVAVASQLGIVSGYGDGNFGPYDLITREQMALMTQKAAKVMNVNLAGASVGAFSDDADIADWSRDAVYELANAGIINGMGDGTFAPKANATRAQASVIIYNTFVK